MALYDGPSINSAPRDSEEEEGPESGETQPLLSTEEGSAQCCSARFNLAFLMFLGFCMVYALRVNLSVVMVAMVNGTVTQPIGNSSQAEVCPKHSSPEGNSTNEGPPGVPQYDWSSETQGVILSSFFYGYILTQVVGGYVSDRFGGKLFLGLGVLCTAVLTLLTPLAASLGVPYLIALRAAEGVGEGVSFPAMNAMWARWAPPLERSRLVTFSAAGVSFGTFVALPLTGFMCQSLGWPSVFYIFGAAGCVWSVFWFTLVSDEPRSHPRISKSELNYITDSIGSQGSAQGWSVPALSMLGSLPLWSIVVAHFSANWSYYTLLTTLPTYMDQVLRFNIKENGFLSALPYLCCFPVGLLSGVLADFLQERRLLSTTAVRKIFTVSGMVFPAVFLVATAFIGCDYRWAVAFLTVSSALSGIISAGFSMNHLDIAPRYAGILLGITNSFGTIPGIAAPTVVGYLTAQHSLSGWRLVFFISAGINVFGALFYCICGTGQLQSWAREEQRPGEGHKDRWAGDC